MKFKNYVNSYTKDNRIYSKEDISNMSVRDAYGKKRAILAQNRRIGVPSDAELRNSSNVIWVNPYRREDGTEVKGYWRSKSGSAIGSTGGIVGDNNIPPMDEQSDDIEDIIYGKKKRTGDIQDIDMDGGDEEISPVSATVDLIVALSQIFLKDTEIGEIIEAFAPVIKAIGEKVFGDDDLDFEIDDQYSEQAEESIDSPENVQTDSSINPIEQISEPNGLEGTLTGGASEINNQKILVSPWNSPFLPKANNENYKLKNELIRFNNEQNKNYKDAKDLMNIALIGPENIQSNPEYKRIDKNDIKRLSKNIGDKLDSKFTTIKFEPNSSLATSINSSPSLKQSINSWCKQTENERGQTISVTINDNENLFRSINNATILNPKIENGVFTGYLYDKYDFKPDEFKDKYTTAVNTGAVTLQTVGILKNYNILVPIKMDLK